MAYPVTEAQVLRGPKPRKVAEGRIPAGDNAKVQYERSRVGGIVIATGDIAVLAACILALWLTHATTEVITAVLTSAFAVIGSMTSAYFGIRAVSNVAQSQQPGKTDGPE